MIAGLRLALGLGRSGADVRQGRARAALRCLFLLRLGLSGAAVRQARSRAVLGCLFVLGLCLSVAEAAEVRRFAVVAAHPYGGGGTETLLYAERDARKVSSVLVELGGFRGEDVALLVAPTPATLEAALVRAEAEVARARAAGAQALLLFYYSGHARGGHLLLGGAPFEMGRLRRALAESGAEVRLGFLDACESGAITRLKGGRRAPSFLVDVEPQNLSRGHVIITSSGEHEASQESDDIGGSFFTHYLVSGLRGAADKSGDAQVTLSEAYGYAYDRTVDHTTHTRAGPQHPTYTYDLQGNGALVLTRLSGLSGLVFPSTASGTYLVYDLDREGVVAEVRKTSGEPRRLSVPAGRYAVRKRAPDHLLVQQIALSPRQQIEVDEGGFRAVAFADEVAKGTLRLEDALQSQPRWDLSARVGYQSFFDADARRDLLLPSPLLGLRADWANALAPRLSLHLDAAYGRTSDEPAIGARGERVPVDFSLVVGGAGLTWDPWLGAVRFQLGPRISGVYARRDFPQGQLPFQDLFTICPGLTLGAATWLGPVALGVEARAHYLRYATESEDRSLGFGEGYLTVGFSP